MHWLRFSVGRANLVIRHNRRTAVRLLLGLIRVRLVPAAPSSLSSFLQPRRRPTTEGRRVGPFSHSPPRLFDLFDSYETDLGYYFSAVGNQHKSGVIFLETPELETPSSHSASRSTVPTSFTIHTTSILESLKHMHRP